MKYCFYLMSQSHVYDNQRISMFSDLCKLSKYSQAANSGQNVTSTQLQTSLSEHFMQSN